MNCKGIELFLELSPKTKYWSLAQVWTREEKVCCSVCFSQKVQMTFFFGELVGCTDVSWLLAIFIFFLPRFRSGVSMLQVVQTYKHSSSNFKTRSNSSQPNLRQNQAESQTNEFRTYLLH